jgi:hypothetical protein
MKRTTLKDLNGNVVKASDLGENLLKNFKRGTVSTLRNNEWTFWAEVEHRSKRGNTLRYCSITYGHFFVVNLDDNTVMIEG